jgi:CBS domain-containing protein
MRARCAAILVIWHQALTKIKEAARQTPKMNPQAGARAAGGNDAKDMAMAIGQICNREVVSAARDTTVQAAAKLMRHFHVGTVVVVDAGDDSRVPVGIVTDRDIVIEVCAVDLNQNVITVGDIMAPELATVREDEGLLQTVEIMRHKGVRRLPVVDKNGSLTGIVSIDDLFEALTEQMAEMGRILGREREREIRNRR